MEPKIRLITGPDGMTQFEVIKYSYATRRYTILGRFRTRKEAQKFIDSKDRDKRRSSTEVDE